MATERETIAPAELDERGVIVACPQCGQRNRLAYERLGRPGRCGACGAALPVPDEPIEITDEAGFDALTRRSALPVLVDFWAPWCGPCKMMSPEVAAAARTAEGRWLAVKLNTDDLPGPAQRFDVRSIPLLVLFRDGHEVARSAGARPASAIQAFVEQRIG